MSYPVQSAGTTIVIVRETKSVGVALLLTFLFGPLGMFYATATGALVVIIASVVLAFFTLGFSLLLAWPVSMIWGAIAASEHNRRVLSGIR